MSAAAIQASVARHYGISPAALLSPNRSAQIAKARHVAMWITRATSNRSLPSIGRVFGRDHTTTLHGIRRISDLMERDDRFKQEVLALLRPHLPQ